LGFVEQEVPENQKRIVAKYRQAFAKHGAVPAALFWPKGRQNRRFGALSKNLPPDGSISILDFGCGFGDMSAFVAAARPALQIEYLGIDIVPEFIQEAKARYPKQNFSCDADIFSRDVSFDYVFVSGAFNLRYFDDEDANERYVFSLMSKLFDIAQIELAVDFMRTDVDFRQAEAHHQNPTSLLQFTEKSLSRYFLVDASYLPYEYCLHLFREEPSRASDD
jgi:SAM-dependent methyltransferase